jgi:hypothetical protein
VFDNAFVMQMTSNTESLAEGVKPIRAHLVESVRSGVEVEPDLLE